MAKGSTFKLSASSPKIQPLICKQQPRRQIFSNKNITAIWKMTYPYVSSKERIVYGRSKAGKERRAAY